jgi:hypothetical protein
LGFEGFGLVPHGLGVAPDVDAILIQDATRAQKRTIDSNLRLGGTCYRASGFGPSVWG